MYRPLPDYLTIKESSVHGLGLFTNEYIVDEIEIGITHVKNDKFEDGYIRTPLGGFINHSEDPNCEWIEENDMIVIKALRDISPGEEITLKYKWYDPKK